MDTEELLSQLKRLAADRVRSQRPKDAALQPLFKALQRVVIDTPKGVPVPDAQVAVLKPILRLFGAPDAFDDRARLKPMLRACLDAAPDEERATWERVLATDDTMASRLAPKRKPYNTQMPTTIHDFAYLLAGVVEHLVGRPRESGVPQSAASEPSSGVDPARLALSTLGAGHLEVWSAGADGHLWHSWWWQQPGTWSRWEELDASKLVARFAVSQHRASSEELLVATSAGGLLHRTNTFGDTGSTWSGWQNLAPLPECAAAKSLGLSTATAGHLEAWVCDEGGRLWHAWRQEPDPWLAWQAFSTPAPVRAFANGHYRDRHQELFIVTDDGSVHHCWNSMDDAGDGWHEWIPFRPLPDGRFVMQMGLSTLADDHLEVWASDAAGGLWHSWWRHSEDWSEWTPFDLDQPVTGFAVGQHSAGAHELVVATVGLEMRHYWNVLPESRQTWHSEALAAPPSPHP